MTMRLATEGFRERLANRPFVDRYGSLLGFNGLVIEADGPDVRIGELCDVDCGEAGLCIRAEVVGFRDGRVLLMAFGHLRGVAVGARIRARGCSLQVPVGKGLIGRVIDPFGVPLDGGANIVIEAHSSHQSDAARATGQDT
jgi:flagellum-specific ATP synthase